ncbi:procathepsin L-like [Hyalella azteca]|uniref:Procathepsin L-like n=1 Tax=Hyalella azteca TaxID=294128 RepID=A0A979FTH7_HYAAZ|nr:procathepsin L-like [Hyalella azteca]
MATLAVFLSLLAIASAWHFKQIFDQEFINYKITHKKTYSSFVEETIRYNVFLENKLRMSQHNEKFARGEVSYELGETQFADQTHDEHRQVLGLLSLPEFDVAYLERETRRVAASVVAVKDDGLPDYLDWREKGAVTPVKNQDRCGSCWAFSAVGALEGQIFRNTGVLRSLSVQQVVDCTENALGCAGGLPALAYEQIERSGGLATEEDYPYITYQGNCSMRHMDGGVDHGYRAFKKNDEQALKEAVSKYGPISVAFSVLDDFIHYKRGVYECSKRAALNHAVLLVGYGSDEVDGDYWIIKNSWGVNWGERGYFRMARNKNNTCFIAAQSSIPDVWFHGN